MLSQYTPADVQRFWSGVTFTDSCWVWNRATSGKGRYGSFWLINKTVSSHRVSFELTYGIIPPGMWVLHHCDNPPCVRPDHLYLGTVHDNVRDAVERGRIARGIHSSSYLHPESRPRGERNGAYTHPERVPRGDRHMSRTRPETLRRGIEHHNAKLTPEKVLSIRHLYNTEGISMMMLAERFGVSKRTILNVLHGRIWKHV